MRPAVPTAGGASAEGMVHAVGTSRSLAIVLAAIFVCAGAPAAVAEGSTFEWDPGPKLQFMDGKYTIQLRGLVQTDYVHTAGGSAVDASEIDLRRARLGIEGVVWHNVDYEFEVDFAGSGVVVTDAFFLVPRRRATHPSGWPV